MAGTIEEQQQKKDLKEKTLEWMEATIIRNYIGCWNVSESCLKILVEKDNPSGADVRKVQTTLEGIAYGFIMTGKMLKSTEDFNKTLLEELERRQTETSMLLYDWRRLYPLRETIEIV